MTHPLPPGKLPPELLRELLSSASPLGAEVRLGPSIGEDACAIDVPEGTLIAAADPITLTGSGVGAHAVTINANDIAVMGVRPRWFMAVVLLPVNTFESEVRELFSAMREALDALGASLVGGHTEVTTVVSQPVIVGQMMGFSTEHRFIPTGGVEPGHVIIQAGAAPVEAAAVLAQGLADRLDSIDAAMLARAREATSRPGISIVESALLAAEGGAAALHDPTEGGLAAGLYELADASGVRIRLDERSVLWFEPGVALCRALKVDPWGALASGALLAALPPQKGDAVCRKLEEHRIPARVIGTAEAGVGVVLSDGTPLPSFARDEVSRVLGDC